MPQLRGVPSLPLLIVPVLVATFATAAAARPCGDDVDGRGRRVPCACGDVVVGSTRLVATDPVVQAPCPAGGLLVDVRSTAHAATIDLDGHDIVGSGRGIGIEVLAGGPHGIAIVGPGRVRGFDVGVAAREGALASISSVHAIGNARDGFRLAGRDYRLVACVAERNGRDGFVLHGAGYRLDDCRAVANGRDGFAVRGRPATPVDAGNVAEANGRGNARARRRGRRTAEAP